MQPLHVRNLQYQVFRCCKLAENVFFSSFNFQEIIQDGFICGVPGRCPVVFWVAMRAHWDGVDTMDTVPMSLDPKYPQSTPAHPMIPKKMLSQ